MCDGESEKGACTLPLGVPLYVPVADILIKLFVFENGRS
jgi:hypothetical protein